MKRLVVMAFLAASLAGAQSRAQREMERLGRGAVAVPQEDGSVFIGWRLLDTDPDDAAFDVYHAVGRGMPVKLNPEPITRSTCFVVNGDSAQPDALYFPRAVHRGEEQPPGKAAFSTWPGRQYFSIRLRTPDGYTPNDGSVGDLDGDGEYEIVLHQAGRSRDNSQKGQTDPPILQAYRLDGHMLWQISLGRNIREGAHYTQFLVYDLDADGRAELVCKTADGTIDGVGNVIGGGDADHRNKDGFVLDGPEFLTVFDGLTGRALASTDYLPPRGNVAAWGDDYGNRCDRFLACVAYLDGKRPSIVMCRGYYTRAVLVAWDWRLRHRWTFDSDDPAAPGNRAYRGQGNHSLAVADVDGDGRDEIVYGACVIDDDGRGLYSSGLGHGDALHVSDIDPDRPGLEVFAIHERPGHHNAAELHDALTGKVLWGKPAPDVGRGVAMDIDPRHRGYESWTSGSALRGVWNVNGQEISPKRPRSCNFGIWWDGDLLRELLDGNVISKWDWLRENDVDLLVAEGCASNNGTKATPVLCADILGDWREEVIWRTSDNRELRVFTTTIPTAHRMRTLMLDPQYRLSVAWQNVGYNQPAQPGFYLGE